MKDKIKIMQHYVCIGNENIRSQLILLFIDEAKIIGIGIVEYPSWFHYYDENYICVSSLSKHLGFDIKRIKEIKVLIFNIFRSVRQKSCCFIVNMC
jgi:hypothetical protein